MKILTTPEERFDNLPDFDFKPHYVNVDGLKMCYIDKGIGATILLLHGEPSWSFLYRRMIKKLVSAGYRVVCPDLIGFGRSEKPVDAEVYTYENHVAWVHSFIKELKLDQINLFCQDWGGLIGLRLVAFHPELFLRVMASNTFLPTGDHEVSKEFFQWQRFAKESPDFVISKVIQMGTLEDLSAEVLVAYDAPFPTEEYKVGARVFPQIVPILPEDPQAKINKAAWHELMKFERPFLTAFGDSDPITGGGGKVFQKLIPGCQGLFHPIITGGGHFIQEDKPDVLATILANFIKNAKVASD